MLFVRRCHGDDCHPRVHDGRPHHHHGQTREVPGGPPEHRLGVGGRGHSPGTGGSHGLPILQVQ